MPLAAAEVDAPEAAAAELRSERRVAVEFARCHRGASSRGSGFLLLAAHVIVPDGAQRQLTYLTAWQHWSFADFRFS